MKQKYRNMTRGYKKDAKSYQNQVPILGGKGMLYTTPYSNGNYYFRTYIVDERKDYRVSFKTKILGDAIKMGETEMLEILNKQSQGHKVFGKSWGELCNEFIKHNQDRVSVGNLSKTSFRASKSGIKTWIIKYLGESYRINGLTKNSFLEYAMKRRLKVEGGVEETTIKNEQTIINSIIKFAERKGYIPFNKCEVEKIKTTEHQRRDTFTPEEYKIFYTKMRGWINDSEKPDEIYYRSLIRDFCLIASNSCCRFGELLQLKWKMVKITEYKGHKLFTLDLPKEICKNRKARRVFARGGEYFERLKKNSNFTEADNFVFSMKNTDKMVFRRIMYEYWKELMKYTGMDKIGKKITYYSFRHFGITARLYAKVPVYEVSKMAGTDVSFIQKHYEHLDMEKLRDSALKSYKMDKDGIITPV